MTSVHVYSVVIIGRYYNGHMPMLAVTDVDMLKQILVKEFDAFMDRPVSICRFFFVEQF